MRKPKIRKTRRYGLWLLSSPQPLRNGRVRREDGQGDELPTLFQRAVGVRYSGRQGRRIPDSRGAYAAFGPMGPPRGLLDLMTGHDDAGVLPRHRRRLQPGSAGRLQSSTGFVLLWMPHIRHRSVAGAAWYAGCCYLRDDV